MYLGYIAIYFICNVINGEYLILYTYHIPSVIIAHSIPIMVNEQKHLQVFTYLLILPIFGVREIKRMCQKYFEPNTCQIKY